MNSNKKPNPAHQKVSDEIYQPKDDETMMGASLQSDQIMASMQQSD